ncbi:MAG: PASTA domain-containing protein [Actinomycetota bacterium]|nr:PASTA domain-containing protein [Actinomycetota bacterium]
MPGSVVGDLAGRVLAGRYVLQAAVGAGASGRVYVAQDTRLQRRVAVKVLHAALADDNAFLRRFRAEAQVAASLHHPHIVTVHDWGEDEMPYMVLELLSGGSLRSMLDEGNLLTIPQAARVARDVASALEYAHARGILHRDVKPANLLFDEHGIVRVADFGLARALAEASWTEPHGAVFGTARYASPEQATGSQLDARSDLYALSLVLVEAVTASVPFSADTTLGMLSARTMRPVTAPDEVGPLGPVIERAGRIDANERYPDAATMRAALSDVAESLPPPTPLRLAGMADRADSDPTQAHRAPGASTALFDQDAGDTSDDLIIEAIPVDMRMTGERRRIVPFVVGVVLVIAIAVAALALTRVGGTEVEVPGVVGRTLEDAQALAATVDLELEVVSEQHAPDPAGTIIDQEPAGGESTRSDTVSVVVSTGPAPVDVPNVVGASWAQAETMLAEAGLRAEPVQEFNADVPVDVVASIDPAAGEQVPPESLVRVVISKGHAPVAVPDVRAMSFEDAQAALTAVGFQVQRVDEFSDEVAKDTVIGTAPETAVEAPFESPVQVVVSKGQDLVAVPDVSGETLDDATAMLEAAGFGVVFEGQYRAGRPIQFQDPDAGSMAKRGSTVTVRQQPGGGNG